MLTNPQGTTSAQAMGGPSLSSPSPNPFPVVRFGSLRTFSWSDLCTVARRAAYISGYLINIILNLTLLGRKKNATWYFCVESTFHL